MKSSATMYRIAKAMAVGNGIRVYKGARAGFYVTIGELQDHYTNLGYNRRGTAMRRHIDTWMATDRAVAEGGLEDPQTAVWFPCPPEMRTQVLCASEKCGGRCVIEIERTEWPVLRRMHGIQDVVIEGAEA